MTASALTQYPSAIEHIALHAHAAELAASAKERALMLERERGMVEMVAHLFSVSIKQVKDDLHAELALQALSSASSSNLREESDD